MSTRPAHSERAHARRELGSGAIFTLAEAAQLLPMGEASRDWLIAEGLVSVVCGRELVVWADVQARIRMARPDPKPKRGRVLPFVDPG